MHRHFEVSTTKPKKVVITGASGNIGYILSFMVSQGRLLGPSQPIELWLLEIPPMAKALEGVRMELLDSALPCVRSIVASTNQEEAFTNADIALLVGAKPRGPGMKRKDLLEANAKIFASQGDILNRLANVDVKVVVVGNPANTNAVIIASQATRIKKRNITALTRLDHNRALGQLSEKMNMPVSNIRNVAIWGNHSASQYPHVRNAELLSGQKLTDALAKEGKWLRETFIPKVQKRGAEIISMRKKSSAASAANATCDHIHDWLCGTRPGEWVSMAVWSDGNPYGIKPGLIFSFPVKCQNGEWEIVKGLDVSDKLSKEKLKITEAELVKEKQTALKVVGL
jgi:malate dehydrogenase